MVSHIVGGGFAVVALVLCVVWASLHQNGWGLAGGIVYGVSMLLCYTISSVYHGLRPHMGKKVMQVIDHCAIFILIAGSYTPIALVCLREVHPILGWGLFGFVWACAALGIALTAVDLRKFRVFSMVCYIGLGWCAVFLLPFLLDSMTIADFAWLLGGGVSFTVGSVLYGLGRKHKFMHSIFHLFVVLGSILQFVTIFGLM